MLHYIGDTLTSSDLFTGNAEIHWYCLKLLQLLSRLNYSLARLLDSFF